MAFFDFASTDSFHYAATVIRFPCNSPPCSTSFTPCTHYYFIFEPLIPHHCPPTYQFLQLQWHLRFRQPGPLLHLHPTYRQHHHLHLYQDHRTHPVSCNHHHWLLRHRLFLQLHLNSRKSKQLQKFHQARNWTNYAAQLPRLLRLHLPLHLHSQRLHLHRLSQQKWQRLGSTTQQLVESVRLIQAQQQTILDSQRLHEQRQQLLHQDLPPIGSTPPTPSPTLTPPSTPTTMPPPSAKARPTEPTAPGSQYYYLGSHRHPILGRRHHHREDPAPEHGDHGPHDHLHTLIAGLLLIDVQTDLVHLCLDIDPQPNIPKIAEHLPLTDDDRSSTSSLQSSTSLQNSSSASSRP